MFRVRSTSTGSALAQAALLTQMLFAPFVLAEDAAKPAAAAQRKVLEEIVVTGTKRDVKQQDAPVAVSTVTALDIERTFSTDLRTVSTLAPNVTFTNQTGFNAIAGGIRGTGSISILTTQDPSVGISVDEFALSHVQAQFVELFDIEQIEVYRGPQGTLFGKNSDGGAILITTKRPNLQEFGATVGLTYGRVGRGNEVRKVKAAFDVPFIPGELSFRFAGVYDNAEGYYRNSKAAANFPKHVPIFGFVGLPVDNPPLPPELNTRTVGNNEKLGGKNVFAGKAKILWQPNDKYEAYGIYEIVRDRSDSPPGVNETPAGEGFLFQNLGFDGIKAAGHNNPYKTGVSQQGNGINIRDGHQVDVNGGYLNQRLDWGKFSIRSITGYRYQEETLPSTYTGEAFVSLFDASRNLERRQLQQEFRLVSNFEGPFNFVGGAAYFEDNLDFRAIATVGLQGILPSFNPAKRPFLDSRGFINLDLDTINDPGVGNVKQNRKSWAVYGDGTYNFTDRLSLTAGLRYTSDSKDFEHNANGGGVCNQFTKAKDATLINPAAAFSLANCKSDARSNALSRIGLRGDQYDPRKNLLANSQFGLNVKASDHWEDPTFRVALNFKPTESQLVYGTIATGYISGGFSETCSSVVTCRPFSEEKNVNFEVGYKGDLLDNSLRLNVALFYMKFKDLQRNQVVPFRNAAGNADQETITVNAGESHSAGVEIETTWLPIENLQLRLNLGYLKAQYDKFKFDPQPNPPGPGQRLVDVVDFKKLDIPFAPEFNVGFDATYTHPMATGASVVMNLNGHLQPKAETSPFDPNAAADRGIVRQPTNSQIQRNRLVNASVTYNATDDKYHVSLYGRNLLDDRYRATANSVSNLWNFTQYGPPLEWGIEFGMNLH